jgi:BirA family transcriptional regulator, biotin operon repressor / biotin---[acetyl-CoA-carboxylase] ligase
LIAPDADRVRLPPDFRLVARDSVGSTNDEAKIFAREGAGDLTLVWAREQTAGRGRQGRTWVSPRGNLYLSLVLRPNVPAAQAAQLSFVACVAVGATVAELGATKIDYKWPNDVLVGGRKISGVLLEAESGAGGLEFLILGVGVNLASSPEETRYPATSLQGAASVEAALGAFARHFGHWYRRWTGEGFAPIRAAWLDRAARLGEPIEVRLPDRTLDGIFAALGAGGELLLDTAAGRRIVTAGDVHLPGIG